MSRRLRTALVLAALVAAAFFWWRFDLLWWVRRDHPVGVDVSHHQGPIDWPRVRAAGAAFAFLKATEGGDFVDPRFAENWRGTGRAGLLRGAYHFFTFCRPGRDQAANFVAYVPRDPSALPPVIDLEVGGNCTARPAPDRLKAELDDFLRVVEPHCGKPAILYMTEEFHARYGALAEGRALFLRELFFTPRWPEGRAWLFWQFHDGGHVDGIDGPVDLDAFAGPADDLHALARPVE